MHLVKSVEPQMKKSAVWGWGIVENVSAPIRELCRCSVSPMVSLVMKWCVVSVGNCSLMSASSSRKMMLSRVRVE